MKMIEGVGVLVLIGICAGCQQPGGPMGKGGGKKMTGAEFVAQLDKNNDNLVSAEEFDGPAEIFAELDANGDGFLSEDEAPTGPPPGGERGGRR
ncbi:hypothetical protein P4C99_21275 [Pontiellaceae bacterium B1224]|nr:hypothetical protein [Pontiellaceae bacterium B1224]